jgi:tetratricopeptide (TPR) repeat protein
MAPWNWLGMWVGISFLLKNKLITMLNCKVILTFILSFLSVINLNAQEKELIRKDKSACLKAKSIAEKAYSLWDKGDISEAEKLYYESLNTYPTIFFFPLVSKKMKMGDISGAKKESDTLISRVLKMNNIMTYNPNGGSFKYTTSNDLIDDILIKRAEANFLDGDISSSLKDLKSIKNTIKWTKEYYGFLGEVAILTGDFITAQNCIDTLFVMYKGKKLVIDQQLTPVYLSAKLSLAKNENEKCIQFATELEEADKGPNTQWKPVARLMIAEANINLGNVEKAKIYYEAAIKNVILTRNSPDVTYVGGQIAIFEKDYNYAIDRFNTYLGYKSSYLKREIVYGKQRIYTKRAEVYAILKNYTQAKKDYEAALIFYPGYEPAVNGLAKLEGKIETERITDKTPPVISITEPTNMRGLKIVISGKDVLIKGTALDPSGLKLVNINGNIIYSQEDGNFWGTVQLSEGNNHIKIIATDKAGNSSEQLFEIEKSITPISTKSDIVPVEIKDGKNYAVFIASQNYEDQTIPSLENPIIDAVKLKLTLKSTYNFSEDNIISLYNPSTNDFKKKFIELNEMIRPEDNLIIFYAGHGIWVDKEKKGYWLLTDAKRNDVNSWLPNKLVLEMIASLPARHTLLITDACFSGSVFKTRSIGADAPPAVREMSEKISRVAITSGNDTEVPDQSVFMKYLIKALSENKEKFLTAQKMFITQIIEAVMTESKTEPRYGTLELAGHVGGDFIFIKK